MATLESTVQECFRNAGARVSQGLPFCHPGDCSHGGKPDCEWQVFVSGGTWTTPQGDSIPLHTQYMICAEHAPKE